MRAGGIVARSANQSNGRFYALLWRTIPQSASLTAPFTQGSLLAKSSFPEQLHPGTSSSDPYAIRIALRASQVKWQDEVSFFKEHQIHSLFDVPDPVGPAVAQFLIEMAELFFLQDGVQLPVRIGRIH